MVLQALCIISEWVAAQEDFDCFASLPVLAASHFEFSYPDKGEWNLPSASMTPLLRTSVTLDMRRLNSLILDMLMNSDLED